MRLAAAWITERQHVLPAIEKAAVQQRFNLARRLRRQTLHLEVLHGLFQRQPRDAEQLNDAVLSTLLALAFHQFEQVLLVPQGLAFGLACLILEAAPDRRQVQFLQVLVEVFLPTLRLAHWVTPAGLPPSSSSKLARATSATATSVTGGAVSGRRRRIAV